MGRYDVQEISTLQDDFHRGVVGRVSPLGLKKGSPPPPFVKSSNNVFFRPSRAFSVRPGYRDASQVVLNEPPVSIGKHYASSNRMFVATNAGAGAGNLWLYTTASRTLQTLPFSATDQRWRFEMANGLLVACQQGHAQAPCFYAVGNTANTWYSLVLPKPTTAVTFGTNTSGGSIAVSKDYFYRVRWNFLNGSSLAGPASAAHQAVAASGNYTFALTIPNYTGARTDFVNWTLERTKQNGTLNGPWFKVTDGTGTTASDGRSDASLFYEMDDTLHGEPQPMDGVIFHRNRLFGWYGSSLYMSQPVVGLEATGIANWIGDAIFPVGKDDGDEIQQVVIQGDRLLIGKRHSLWTLEGDDENSFRLVIRFEGAGFCGPRAAAPLGSTVFFAATEGRFFVMRGNSVEPVGTQEIGDYLALMDTGRSDEIIALNYLGDFVLFWYVPNGHEYADELLAYDLRYGNWSHHTNMPAVDALVQKDVTDFGDATLLFADPRLLSPGNASTTATNPSFVIYMDNVGSDKIMVQKYNSNGTAAWASPVQVSNNAAGALTGEWREARLCDDGAGGVIVLWNDTRNGLTHDLYGQRLNSAGAPQWLGGGIRLEHDAGTQSWFPLGTVIPDGAGGCVYAFQDLNANSELLVQRLNSSGAKQWGSGTAVPAITTRPITGSIPICYQIRAIGNADGSFTFVWVTKWYDGWNGTYHYIVAQRVSSSGALLWGGAGKVVQGTYGGQFDIEAVADGFGGVIVGWSYAGAIKVQRYDSSGANLWGGWALVGTCTGTNDTCLTLVATGDGGCMVAWADIVDAATTNLMVRKMQSSGLPAFNAVVAGPSASQKCECLASVPDGYGGIIVARKNGGTAQQPYNGLYVSRVASDASVQWSNRISASVPYYWSDGSFVYSYKHMQIVTDGAGGAIVYWTDDTAGRQVPTARNVYAQRITVGGSVVWATNGVHVANAAGEQRFQSAMFTGTSESEYPPGALSGYHIWCGFSGTRDKASADGSGGDLIPVFVKGHLYDDGMPNNTKDYEWFELYVNRGKGTVVATISPDVGPVATLTLSTEVRSPKYNSGLKYNTGVKYASRGGAKVGSGLPKGTEGRSCSITLSGNLEDMEFGGWMLQSFALPRKEY